MAMTETHIPDLVGQKEIILSQFKCQNSGNCCRCAGYVYVTKKEIDQMAEIKQEHPALFIQNYVRRENGWDVIAGPSFRPQCFLNTSNQCDVYEARPQACRSYPDWPEIWESNASILKESESCPGLKKAIEKVRKGKI